ncbi:MAG: PIN domain-containing protein [Nitrososphaerales archaeon]|jgi:predicted nucleic acid-binding protein
MNREGEEEEEGLDSSIVVYAMDPTTDEHAASTEAILALQGGWAVNPTVIHEVYHTLVFKRKMPPADARSKLGTLIKDRRTRFLNTTKTVTSFSLELAAESGMGGRDALIVGSFLHGGIGQMLTHDGDLLRRSALRFRGREIAFSDPLA